MVRNLVLAACLLVAATATAKAPKAPTPGNYLCKISKEYKFRPCTITRTGGRLVVDIPEGGLLGITADLRVSDDGYLYFDGKLNERRPWGCYSCTEKCSQTKDCPCKDVPSEVSSQCKAQSMSALLKRQGNRWSGKLPFRRPVVVWGDVNGKRQPVGSAIEVDVYELVIKKKVMKKK